MKVVTSQEMRQIDQRSIHDLGIPGVVLMENAGRAVAKVIEEIFVSPKNKSIVILCGPGNNGGDGLVVARYLHGRQARIRLFLVGKKDNIRGEAETNLRIALNLGLVVKEIISPDDLNSLANELKNSDLVVDALLGTGASGPLRGMIKETVSLINRCSSKKLSIDIPTGVNANTGEVIDCLLYTSPSPRD